MICPYCRNENNNDAKVCVKCGNSLTQISQNNIQQNVMQSNTIQNQNLQFNTNIKNNSNKNNNKTIIVIAIVILLIAGILVIMNVFGDKKEPSNNNSNVNNSSNNTNNDNKEGITIRKYDADGDFLLYIDKVVKYTNRNVDVVGIIERGEVKYGDEVQIVGLDHEVVKTYVNRISSYRNTTDSGKAGDTVYISLTNVYNVDIERGQALIKPNSVLTHKKFKANVKVLTKEESGNTSSISNASVANFYIGSAIIPCTTNLENNIKEIGQGKDGEVTITLNKSLVIEPGNEFFIRDDNNAILTGTIKEVLD